MEVVYSQKAYSQVEELEKGSWSCYIYMDSELSHAALLSLFNSLPYSKGDRYDQF